MQNTLFMCSLIFISLPTYCYEVETHKDMSEKAAQQSSLNGYLPVIGLKSLEDKLAACRASPLANVQIKQRIAVFCDTISRCQTTSYFKTS